MIISVSGYNYTGSGAIFDLLKEYDEINAVDGEIGFIYLPDGLVDLDYNLNNSSTYLNGDVAIDRFWKLCQKSPIPREYRQEILELTKNYLSKITQLTWNGNSTFDGTRMDGSRYLWWKIRRMYSIALFHWFKKISSVCDRTMVLAHHPQSFIEETVQYLDGIEKLLSNDGKIPVMNQFFSAYTPEKSMKYSKDGKTIVVDRDPRDVFLVSQKTRRTHCFPYDDVKQFVTYFQTCWSVKESNASERVLRIQFEDAIYKYEETVKRIEDFIGIHSHSLPKTYFKPEKSINNTQLFQRFPEKKEEINYIETHLSEFIYSFPYYRNSEESFF